MGYLLKSYNQPIPGNYFFVQREGIYKTFAANPIIEEVAKAVSAFRIANKIPRGSLAESLADVDAFNCAVRNNDEKYCRKCDSPFEVVQAQHRFVNRSCGGGCGQSVKHD